MKLSDQTNCPKCAATIPDDAPSGLCPSCALAGAATVSSTTSVGRNIAPPSINELAPHFPELEILKLIGAGGMGAVYKARQPQLDRFIALKVLSHNLASDPAFVERFNREARVLGRLSHPNIVGIHDFGTAGPYCYLMMEYVDGVNLRQAMQVGRFTPTEALEMVQHLCSALKFAHEEGVLHRDIKPENILIDSKGRIKVADFGIAKLVGEDRQHDFTLTLQGSVLGSPHYMAPEQIETPGDVDQRADIYSLGVVLYELLTGGLPIGRFALPSEKASMDSRIDHIVMRTLEKEREARYQTAAEVGSEMEAVTKYPASPNHKIASALGEPVAARFSLASALITGSGLLSACVTLYLANTLRDADARTVVIALGLILTGGSAIVGFILGARALGEIRKSVSVKTSLGSAIFATTAWPILTLFSLGTFFLYVPTSGEGGSIGPFMVIIVVMLPVLVAAWLLIRSLYRWATGVERKDGTRFHPGLGIPLLVVMLLSIGGPLLLAEIAVRILPAGPDPHAEARRFMEPGETKGVSVPHETASVDWYHGLPEVNIPLFLHARRKVEFKLIRTFAHDVADENRLQTTDLGKISHAMEIGVNDDYPPYKTHLFIGTTTPRKDGAGLTAVCQWDLNRKVDIDMDFSEWQFEEKLPEELVLSEEGITEYVIATKDKGNPETAEKLVLRAVVTESYE